MAESKWLAFPSAEALELALANGLVPAKIARAPAEIGTARDGRVLVRPHARFRRETLAALVQVGIVGTTAAPETPRHAESWPELLPPRPIAEPLPEPGPVLFDLPPGIAPARLAGELWRLGCDRQHFAAAGARTLLIAIDPPTYPLLRALEHEEGLDAYRPTPPGQLAVWTELGYVHPLAGRIAPPEGLLLIRRDGCWSTFDAPTWTALDAAVRFETRPPQPVEGTARELAFTVPVRLVRGPEQGPSALWVLHGDPIREVEALVRALDEPALDHLLFAAATAADGSLLVVLRARRATEAPAIDLPGDAYVPLRALPRVHVPPRRMLDPPLRAETLARLFCPDADQVAWIESRADGSLVPRTLGEAAFHPLSRWVDYLIDRDASALEAWVDRARFTLEPFTVLSGDTPVDEGPRKPARRRTTGHSRLAIADAPPIEPPVAVPPAPPPPLPALAPLPREPGEIERARTELEAAYLALPLAPDDPARAAPLVALARAYDALGQAGDAGRCRARALWENPAPADVAGEWARAELARAAAPTATAALAGIHCEAPTQDALRSAAAYTIATAMAEADPSLAAAVRAELHPLQLALERGDHVLDARTRWLARAALARLAGDPLLAARAKDQVLASLAGGLVAARDLPGVLRRGLHHGAVGSVGLERDQVVDRLEKIREAWRQDDRRRFQETEVAPAITGAYLDFLVAYALARLGKDEAARTMAQAAVAALPASDSVHALAAAMYHARVHQAIAGLPRHAPLAPELLARAESLDTYALFKINRLRSWSVILEPNEHVDPIEVYLRPVSAPDSLMAEVSALRAIEDPAVLGPRLAAVIERILEADAGSLERVAPAALGLVPRLGERAAVRLVERLAPAMAGLDPPSRALCAERALYVAGLVGDATLARRLLAELRAELDLLPDGAFVALVPAVCAGLRILRRLGLEAEAVALADHLAIRAAHHPRAIVQAQLAQALGYLGRIPAAMALVEQAQGAIDAGHLLHLEQRDLVRALALALHQLPAEHALAGLDRLVARIPTTSDYFMTHPQFPLSVINLVESIVVGLLGFELDLGDEGRRWLDTDELLLRRRVHAEALHLAKP